jgi:hypothetical protein
MSAHYQRYHATFQTVRFYRGFPWTVPEGWFGTYPYQRSLNSPYQRI